MPTPASFKSVSFLSMMALGIAMGRFIKAEEYILPGQDPKETFLKPGTASSVPLEEILSGGPPVDGIPALSRPKKLSAQEADRFLKPEDEVLGLVFGREASAYPIKLLNWHEIVNDEINGTPVAVTYCPLCRSGIVFERRVEGEATEFGVSGLLYKSDLVMYDRKTQSLWSQLMGQSIAGPSTGKSLRRIPVAYTTWGEWKAKHPETRAVSFETGHEREYERDPYRGYESSREIIFPVGKLDPRLHPKEIIFGIKLGAVAAAVPLKILKKKKLISLSLGKEEIVFKYEEGPRAHLKDSREIPGTVAFWFAWAAFHPQTRLVEEKP